MDDRYVLVTTEHRGVFFGKLVEDRQKTVVISEARNVVFWSQECRGFLGLASQGPQKGSKVGPAAPSITLYGVTSLAECSSEAVAKFEAEPWS